MTDLEKVLFYLKKVSEKGSIFSLSRIYELLERLGNPQEKLKIIHVAGTNGKGSFCAMLSSILCKAGLNVGVYTSPYLLTQMESYRLNGKEASKEVFLSAMTKVIEKAEKMSDKPTEYELLTAAAFLMFYQNNCDFCIIECGLGGDTDSTNVISKPVLSVITNVQKDHCRILGNSISEIAAHKAGIIKENCPVLYGGRKDEAFDVIKQKAEKMSAPFYDTDKSSLEVISCDISGTSLNFKNYKNIKLSLLGLYQTRNAVNVLTAVEILQKYGVKISEKAVYEGLASCKWQARFEVVKKDPVIIFDGSHNPDGMKYAVQSIKSYFSVKPILIMGVMADKEYSLYGDMLKNIPEIIFTVTPDNARALDAELLAECFAQKGFKAAACENMNKALKSAVSSAKKENLPIIVMGSLYMYKEFKEEIEKIVC